MDIDRTAKRRRIVEAQEWSNLLAEAKFVELSEWMRTMVTVACTALETMPANSAVDIARLQGKIQTLRAILAEAPRRRAECLGESEESV